MHYIIVIVVIAIIICLQFVSYLNTSFKIRTFTKIFPSDKKKYEIRKANMSGSDTSDNISIEDNGIDVSQLYVKSSNKVMMQIIAAINQYLLKNKGNASDFHLIKDVVERHCDAEEDEISTLQPIPLYLGLMGTMVGIIVGIGSIAISGGFSESTPIDGINTIIERQNTLQSITSISNVESDKSLMDSISELMTCVAIAMIASLVGVLFTTLIAWKSKNAISKVQTNKNWFYSWIQTELLPTLSGDTANALSLLQTNLMSFNSTFDTNVKKMDIALSKVGDVSKEQAELIKLIRDVDICDAAQANIMVLKELKDCTSEMTTFNKYLHNVSGYLNAVNALNTNINEHLNRTAAIEKMGVFFQDEIKQIRARKDLISESIINIDKHMQSSIDAIYANTRTKIDKLNEESIDMYSNVRSNFDKILEQFKQGIKSLDEEMKKVFQDRSTEFDNYLKAQAASLEIKSSVVSSLADEVQMLADTKTAMSDLVSVTKLQNQKLDNLIDSISHISGAPVEPSRKDGLSYVIKWGTLVCIILIVFAFGMYSYNFVLDIYNNIKGTRTSEYVSNYDTRDYTVDNFPGEY